MMVRCGSRLLPVRRHVKSNYRSGLEDRVGEQLKRLGVDAQYESIKIKYRLEEERTYTPDWKLPNGIIVETKGRFVSDDRKKHLLVRAQHPTYDIRFVFTNSAAKINKGSKTSYADWCTKQGFKFADKLIPESWVKE
jgi:hypothetical protein